MLTHGSFEILGHYQGAKHFAKQQQLRLEAPGGVLDFNENSQSDDEVERHRARIMRTPLVRRDCQNPFCQDLIAYDAGVIDPQLPTLAKVSSLLEVLRLVGAMSSWSSFGHSSP